MEQGVRVILHKFLGLVPPPPPSEEKKRPRRARRPGSISWSTFPTWREYARKHKLVSDALTERPSRLTPNDKIRIAEENIVNISADAIVNAANEKIKDGGGITGAIFNAVRKFGNIRAFEADIRVAIPSGELKVSEAVATERGDLYRLPAEAIIHALGPRGKQPGLLSATYTNILNLCVEKGFRSVAIPCISTGNFGYPIQEATPIALTAVRDWLNAPGKMNKIDGIVFCLPPIGQAGAGGSSAVEVYRHSLLTCFPFSLDEVKGEPPPEYATHWVDIPTWPEYVAQKGIKPEFVILRSADPDLNTKIRLHQGNITMIAIDAIVIPTNSKLDFHGATGVSGALIRESEEGDVYGSGVETVFLETIKTILSQHGGEIGVGEVVDVDTRFFHFEKHIGHVIYTVGPKKKKGNDPDYALLAQTYRNILNLCVEKGFRSVAIPCISTGNFGFPGNEAASVAARTVHEWLSDHKKKAAAIKCIVFCVWTDEDRTRYETCLSMYFPVKGKRK